MRKRPAPAIGAGVLLLLLAVEGLLSVLAGVPTLPLDWRHQLLVWIPARRHRSHEECPPHGPPTAIPISQSSVARRLWERCFFLLGAHMSLPLSRLPGEASTCTYASVSRDCPTCS